MCVLPARRRRPANQAACPSRIQDVAMADVRCAPVRPYIVHPALGTPRGRTLVAAGRATASQSENCRPAAAAEEPQLLHSPRIAFSLGTSYRNPSSTGLRSWQAQWLRGTL